jgi:hypothetical protein
MTDGRTNSMSGRPSGLGAGARQLLDQPDRLIAEMADETGKRGRKRRVHLRAAFPHQRAQSGERPAIERRESRAVGLPGAVDFGAVALRAEHQIGVQPQQAVAPAHRAAFDRFEQEVAPFRLHQLQRGGDRCFGVGNELAPQQRRLPGGERAADGVERSGSGRPHM